MLKEFPTLYKKENSKTRFWKIYVLDNQIFVEYGLTNGKITKPKPQIIPKGIGMTTAHERAIKLAKTKWENKKQSHHFSEEIKNQNFLFQPMAPSNFEKNSQHIHYPAYLQPKLDGFRMYAYLDNNQLKLLSRRHKPIKHLEKLNDVLKPLFQKNPDLILDGELILPNSNFRHLSSILSKNNKNNETNHIKYKVFDCLFKNQNLTFQERWNFLLKTKLDLVPTYLVKNETEIQKYFKDFLKKGYEGAIIRNADGLYKMKSKSKNLQKMKPYAVDKFTIVDFDEGTGNDKGSVIWIVGCLGSNKTFRVKPKGTREERQIYFQNGQKYIGQKINVSYFVLDKEGCVSRIKSGWF